MKSIQQIFISNLKRIRKSRDLSQLKLAELAGIGIGMVGDIETGRRNPSLSTIGKIADALEIPPYYLFFDEESLYPPTDKTEIEQLKSVITDAIGNFLDSQNR